MKTDEFTKADGLKVQAAQLAEWKSVLKPAVFKALTAAVNEANAGITSNRGSDVKRGVDLNNWVGNYMCGHRNHKFY
jgi:hypothetical protein